MEVIQLFRFVVFATILCASISATALESFLKFGDKASRTGSTTDCGAMGAKLNSFTVQDCPTAPCTFVGAQNYTISGCLTSVSDQPSFNVETFVKPSNGTNYVSFRNRTIDSMAFADQECCFSVIFSCPNGITGDFNVKMELKGQDTSTPMFICKEFLVAIQSSTLLHYI